MANYTTLLKGTDTVPALGDAAGDKFLLIGFGHNDEKTEPARYTNPNGDYKTEGSFANSLYVNYIQPALERGVIPVANIISPPSYPISLPIHGLVKHRSRCTTNRLQTCR